MTKNCILLILLTLLIACFSSKPLRAECHPEAILRSMSASDLFDSELDADSMIKYRKTHGIELAPGECFLKLQIMPHISNCIDQVVARRDELAPVVKRDVYDELFHGKIAYRLNKLLNFMNEISLASVIFTEGDEPMIIRVLADGYGSMDSDPLKADLIANSGKWLDRARYLCSFRDMEAQEFERKFTE